MKNKISSNQLLCILLSCRLLVTFTHMSHLHTSLHAGSRVAASALGVLFSLLLSLPVILCLKNTNESSLYNPFDNLSKNTSQFLNLCYVIVFLFAAIITLTRFGLFASTVLLQNEGLYLSVLFLIIIGTYCAQQGFQPLARTSVVFSGILLFSLSALLAGTIGEWNWTNIPPVRKNEISDIIIQAFFSSCRNIEIPALLFVFKDLNNESHTAIPKFIFGFGLFSTLIFVVSGGVLGEFGEQQLFPLFTLSGIAKFGFLERMEDILTGLWIVCAMLRVAFLLYAALQCLQKTIRKETSARHSILAGSLIFAGYLLFSSDIDITLSVLRSRVLPLCYLLFAAILPTFLYFHTKFKNNKEKQK